MRAIVEEIMGTMIMTLAGFVFQLFMIMLIIALAKVILENKK